MRLIWKRDAAPLFWCVYATRPGRGCIARFRDKRDAERFLRP